MTKLVRCQGRDDEQMSLAQHAERSLRLGGTYSLCNCGARCIVTIHNLARLAHQLFDGQNQLFGDEKGQLGKTAVSGFSTFVRRVDCSSGE